MNWGYDGKSTARSITGRVFKCSGFATLQMNAPSGRPFPTALHLERDELLRLRARTRPTPEVLAIATDVVHHLADAGYFPPIDEQWHEESPKRKTDSR